MYSDGKIVQVGDLVNLWGDSWSKGRVKAILHKGLFSEELNKSTWESLDTRGYLIDSSEYGLILYEELDDGISLISREIKI